MSNLADLLAPIAPPAVTERAPAPRRETADRDTKPFAESLDAETSAKPQARDTDETEAATSKTDASEGAEETATAGSVSEGDDASANGEETIAADEDASSKTADSLTASADGTVVVAPIQPDAADAPQELQVTALSGQIIPLAPPKAEAADQPGALAKWFVQASGPAQSNGALNASLQQANGSTSLTQPGSQIMQGAGDQSLDLAANSMKATSEGAPTFADALANTNSDTEGLDAFLSKAMAKTAGASTEATQAPVTQLTTGQTVSSAAQPTMTAVPQGATGQAVPVTALAVEITRQAMNGKTQFDIRLDPPELGRVSVRLEMDGAGQTRTHMIVERAETLEMLTTDARNLERALQQAGLKSDPGSVSFELAQDTTDGFADGQQSASSDDTNGGSSNETDDAFLNGDELSDADLASPEAIRQQLYVTGHLDVRV